MVFQKGNIEWKKALSISNDGSFKSGHKSFWKGKTKDKFPELYAGKHTGRKKEERIKIKCARVGCNVTFENFKHQTKGNKKYCCHECFSRDNVNNLKERHQKGLMKDAYKKMQDTKLAQYKSGELITWNKDLTKETDKRVAKISKGVISAFKAGKYSDKPNKQEKRVMELLQKYNKDFKYVGNGSFWIEDMNPDFINTNGKKQVIEFNGCWWHGCLSCFPSGGAGGIQDNTQDRIERFKQYGFECIPIWEHELSNKKKMEEKIKNL